MERLFGLDFQLIQDVLITGINIFILFLVLSYVCIDMIRDFIRKRQEKIKGELDFAAAEKKDAIALKEEYDVKLRNINAEADEILDAARKKALKQQNEIIDQAKQGCNAWTDAVSGASLTTHGFEEALSKIIAQASWN